MENANHKSGGAKDNLGDYVYFRLCHFCFHLNESDDAVEHCEACYVKFVPAGEFYEDLLEQRRPEDERVQFEEESTSPFTVVQGLEVVW